MITLLTAVFLGALPARCEPFLDGLTAYRKGNYQKAKELMQSAADEGNDYAMAYLAEMNFNESEGSTDTAKAIDLYTAAAKVGNPAGEFGLGLAYDSGMAEAGKSWSYQQYKAVEHYRLAAAKGFTEAKINLAPILIAGLAGSDPAGGAKLLQEAVVVNGGSQWIAMIDMGYCYHKGLGVPKAHGEAQSWDRKAALLLGDDKYLAAVDARENDPMAEFKVGLLKTNKWDCGTESCRAATLAWLRRDAKDGRASAQYIVGAIEEEGFDGRKDAAKAIDWYKKSAVQDYAPAQKRLDALLPKEKEKKEAAAAAEAPKVYSSDVDKAPFKLKERAHDFAFIVGVEKYKNVPEARFAERDAAAFRAHAAALGVPEANIVYLSGAEATRPKIQAYLDEWLPKNVKEDSTLFFYYSGHGAPDAETKQAFLLPWDAEPQFLQSTAYALKDVYASLNKLKAKRVIVALDSCFSGAGGRSVIAPGIRPLVTKINPTQDAGRLVIFAAASGEQVSGSLDDQGHGVFTYYFLKGIEASAKGPADDFTANSVYFYLKPRVEDASARQNRTQTPQLAGQGEEVLVPPAR